MITTIWCLGEGQNSNSHPQGSKYERHTKGIMITIANSYSRVTVVLAINPKELGNQKRLNYLLIEIWKIVEGQSYSKLLDAMQITTLLKVTCQHPHERELVIMKTVHHNAYHNDHNYAKDFGVIISEKLALVEARILPAPWLNIMIAGKKRIACLKLDN